MGDFACAGFDAGQRLAYIGGQEAVLPKFDSKSSK
jgi:hypothetical protein